MVGCGCQPLSAFKQVSAGYFETDPPGNPGRLNFVAYGNNSPTAPRPSSPAHAQPALLAPPTTSLPRRHNNNLDFPSRILDSSRILYSISVTPQTPSQTPRRHPRPQRAPRRGTAAAHQHWSGCSLRGGLRCRDGAARQARGRGGGHAPSPRRGPGVGFSLVRGCGSPAGPEPRRDRPAQHAISDELGRLGTPSAPVRPSLRGLGVIAAAAGQPAIHHRPSWPICRIHRRRAPRYRLPTCHRGAHC